MTTWDIFNLAERIEVTAASIYAEFARKFGADPEIGPLFESLAEEETQHALRVRLLARRYLGDAKLLQQVTGGEELEQCLAYAEAALAQVRAGAWGESLAAIKVRLAALETCMAKAHAQAITQDGNPSLRDFFRQLALQDDAHFALLGLG